MLKEMQKAMGNEYGGRNKIDSNRMLPSNPTPTLKDIGIEKYESSRYQKIAELPEEEGTIVGEGEGE